MKIYEDDTVTVTITAGHAERVRLHYKSIYGDNFHKYYEIDDADNWMADLDSDLQLMGVDDPNEIILTIDDLFA